MPTVDELLQVGWNKQQHGDARGAELIYVQVLRAAPHNANAWCFLGMARHDQRRFVEAEEAYLEAIRLQPNFPIALSNLANTLKSLGRLDEAVARCRESLRLKPDYTTAYNNLGVVLVAQGDVEQAVECFQKAAELSPNNALSHANLGAALVRLGRFDDGLRHVEVTLQLDPQHAEAHKTRSIVRLLRGDVERGWAEYEWRWKCPGEKPPKMDRPLWDGSPLNGRLLLMHCEQGLGDTIHFVRYGRVIQRLGGRSIVVCQPPLMRLLATCPGIDLLAPEGSPFLDYDVGTPMLSLPYLTRTTLATIPAETPYLYAEESRIAKWRDELKQLTGERGLRVGIAWQGSKSHQADAHRSLPLSEFEPLAKVPNVQLFSLQKGAGTEQLVELGGRFPVLDLGSRLDTDGHAFLDTAAVMKNLDLVISSDTSVVHLAGALGVQVWVALCAVPDWRWLLDRADSPWYPTMRLFRQQKLGDWKPVFQEMTTALNAKS